MQKPQIIGTKQNMIFVALHVPVVCGTTQEVQRYLDDNKFKLVSMSLGREGANPDGDMAYLVTYYIKDDETESVSAVTSPSKHETCMLYRSFDLRVWYSNIELLVDYK